MIASARIHLRWTLLKSIVLNPQFTMGGHRQALLRQFGSILSSKANTGSVAFTEPSMEIFKGGDPAFVSRVPAGETVMNLWPVRKKTEI